MLYSNSILLALLSSLVSCVAADCETINGTPYCSKTNKVTYNNLGFSYNKVTNMDDLTGQCSLQPFSFSGPIAPLSEDLSVHIRGPVKLLEFAVYYPSLGKSKRDDDEPTCSSTLLRAHHHHHKRQVVTKLVIQTVMVDASGNPIPPKVPAPAAPGPAAPVPAASPASSTPASSAPTPASSAPTPASSAPTPASSAPTPASSAPTPSKDTDSASSSASSSSRSSKPTRNSLAGGWERTAHFTPNNADGLVFMNHQGGTTLSGKWSPLFGNSISYCNADATKGSSNPVALGDVLVKSNTEYMIFSSEDCDSLCGFYRDGIPAKKGFGGATKIFVFEFEMPTDNAGGLNSDMPAIWLLNAQIPRTLQYGKEECSCWKSGCGELDLFEIVSSGQNKLLTHMHTKQGANGGTGNGGGCSDWFARPTLGSLKAAVIFKDLNIHIVQVDDSFGANLDESTVESWISQKGSTASIGY